MPEVVKFETVIPDGWERCKWEEAEEVVFGNTCHKLGGDIWRSDGRSLYYQDKCVGYLRFVESVGIIPIRKKVVKPLEIDFKPVHDCGHFMGCDIVDQYGNKHNEDSLKGKKFIEVME